MPSFGLVAFGLAGLSSAHAVPQASPAKKTTTHELFLANDMKCFSWWE
jgi:hypothetical protein